MTSPIPSPETEESSTVQPILPYFTQRHFRESISSESPLLGRVTSVTSNQSNEPGLGSKVYLEKICTLNVSEEEEFRLLKLLPGDWDQQIECELRTVRLSENPEYATISYVWGDTSEQEEIVVNGSKFLVVQNLHCALRRIRSHAATRDICIWADAICIDQHSTAERNHQVFLMGKIYSNCQKCLVWLGEFQTTPTDEPSTEEIDTKASGTSWEFTGDASDFGEIWQQYISGFTLRPESTNSLEDIVCSLADCSSVDPALHCAWLFRLLAEGHHRDAIPPFGEGYLKSAYLALFTAVIQECLCYNPWFRRMWVVQEAILAPSIGLMFSSVYMPFEILEQAIAQVDQHRAAGCCLHKDASDDIATPTQNFLSSFSNINQLRKKHREEVTHTLFELCVYFFDRRSTEDFDRVYSLLGLKSIDGRTIIPDYNLDVAQVYTQVAMSYIQTTRDLWPLLYANEKHRHRNTPSWVMDWTASEAYSQAQFHLWIRADKRFRAAGFFSQRHIRSSRGGKAIVVEGLEIDTIAHLGDLLEGDFWSSDFSSEEKTFRNWRDLVALARASNPEYPSIKETWNTAWLRLLCVECVWSPVTRDYKPLGPEEEALYAAVLEAKFPFTVLEPTGSETSLHSGRRDSAVHDIHTNLSLVLHRRKLLITQKGYMGLVRAGSAVGDKVFVLPGCKMPVLLRPEAMEPTDQEPVYSVNSDCYLQGIMNSETVEGLEEGFWEDKDICLI